MEKEDAHAEVSLRWVQEHFWFGRNLAEKSSALPINEN
jgi:hypothetical protein